VIEASACGLPVVVSEAGGLPEVVEDGRTGLVIARDRPDLLADALLRLAGDAALRHRLGEAGRARVQRHYEWRRCVDRMCVLYEGLVTGGVPPGRNGCEPLAPPAAIAPDGASL
jgi:glycosyltransferase involved in cell wall biosynthesis